MHRLIWPLIIAVIAVVVMIQNSASSDPKNYLDKGPFDPHEGLNQYSDSTVSRIYERDKSQGNRFPVGECTWFVEAVHPEHLSVILKSSADAHRWYDLLKEQGFAVGEKPELGAICVWNSNVGGGAGHLAYVTAYYRDGSFYVWDSNWSADLDHKVRGRLITSRKNIIGFVYNRREPLILTVDSRSGWLDTGIDLKVRQSLTIQASGRASYGFEGTHNANLLVDPDGQRFDKAGRSISKKFDQGAVLKSAPIGSLIGSIGQPGKNMLVIGSKYSTAIDLTGRLYLRFNDCPGRYNNNSGSYKVIILVK